VRLQWIVTITTMQNSNNNNSKKWKHLNYKGIIGHQGGGDEKGKV